MRAREETGKLRVRRILGARPRIRRHSNDDSQPRALWRAMRSNLRLQLPFILILSQHRGEWREILANILRLQVCRLSGDDTVSASPAAVTERAGALYYQRAPCVDRESNLSTLEPSPRAEAQGPVDLVRQGPKSRTEVQSPRQPPTAQHRVRREDGSGEGGTQTYDQHPSLAFFSKSGDDPVSPSSFSTRSVFLLFLSSFLNPLLSSAAPPFLGWV